jgi:hypothetical protein
MEFILRWVYFHVLSAWFTQKLVKITTEQIKRMLQCIIHWYWVVRHTQAGAVPGTGFTATAALHIPFSYGVRLEVSANRWQDHAHYHAHCLLSIGLLRYRVLSVSTLWPVWHIVWHSKGLELRPAWPTGSWRPANCFTTWQGHQVENQTLDIPKSWC